MRRTALVLLCAIACSGTAAPPTQPSPDQQAKAAALLTGPDWYRHAVFYEVYVRSFNDSNGDGIGDLAGLTSKLDYLQGLGIDALWLMPIMPTAFKDSGYDVSDYRNIDPDYGDLTAFDTFLAAAHQRNIRVMLDLVLNHTSSQHAWFQESQSSTRNAFADWYIWSDTPSSPDIGCGLYAPTFGDSAWTYSAARNQYYFHRFYAEQPDLNYRNPKVVAETLDVARFWLTHGVDGFRCDAIGLLYESATGCNMIPETVSYIQQLRALVDTFPDRAIVAESDIGLGPTPYLGDGTDMFHMAFDFPYGYFWGVAFLGQSSTIPFDALQTVTQYPTGAQDAMLIGSHDVGRAWSHAEELAWREQRAVEISMFSRATPFIYYGDELGIHDGTAFVVDSRDMARTPMPWTAAADHGFSTSPTLWLPFSDGADQTNVETEDADPTSMLTFYRQLLTFRRGHAVWGNGDMTLITLDNPSLLAFVRSNTEESYLVVECLSEDPQEGFGSVTFSTVGAVAWGNGSASVDGGKIDLKLPGSGSAVFALP
jgi:glycosidase